ncbi:MAG: hypothetical protein ACT4QA_12745 [Panacagrimonas sp.]
MTPRRYSSLFAAILGLSAFNLRAASLPDLMSQVPPPPRDAVTALAWVKDGQIVAPEYTRFKQALEAERAAIVALNGGPLPTPLPAPAPGTAEPSEVQTALKSYSDYLAANSGKQDPASVLGKRARWLHAAMADKMRELLGRMTPCPAPCADPSAVPQDAALLGRRRQMGDQDLRLWSTLFQDWQRSRLELVSEAQSEIAATGEGAKALTAAGKSGVAQYRAAMLKEVETTLSVTELAVRRIDALERGDVDAVSKSTYSPKPKKSY